MKKKFLLLHLFLFSFLLINAQIKLASNTYIPSQTNPLKLAGIFGNHMVIQQGINAPVWGTALPNSTVKVELAGTVSVAKADPAGKWMIRMPVLEAGGPYEMKVTGTNTIIFNDVMIGEVWLASGQSNMAMSVVSAEGDHFGKSAEEYTFPKIRLFTVPNKTAIVPVSDIDSAAWKLCEPSSIKDFTAAGFYFARELYQHQKVAVGIISSSKGATNVEAWMSADILATIPEFRNKVLTTDRDEQKWNEFARKGIEADQIREVLAKTATEGIKSGVHLPEYNDSGWKKTLIPLDMPSLGLNGYWGFVWMRKHFELSSADTSSDLNIHLVLNSTYNTVYCNGIEIAKNQNQLKPKNILIPKNLVHAGYNVIAIKMVVYWGSANLGLKGEDAFIEAGSNQEKISLGGEWLFNSKIEPVLPQWQDYFNRDNVLFNARIAPIIPYGIKGVIWYQGENNIRKAALYQKLFPMLIEDWRIRWGLGYFPFLYVQLANYNARKDKPVEDDLAELREAQLFTLRYPNTGMVVTSDIGDANDIHPKDKLDVGKRLFLAALKVAYHENIVYSGPLYDSAKAEGSKMRLYFSSVGSGLISKNGEVLKNFAMAGDDHQFYWANAVIVNNTVEVSCPSVPVPIAVRYSWESNPDGNLYNKEGLPASPFRTDQWVNPNKK